jgi:Rieske Fe-S protein
MKRLLGRFSALIASVLLGSYSAMSGAGYSSTVFDAPKDIVVNTSHILPGHALVLDWNGHGVLIYHRTAKDIQHLKNRFRGLADPYGRELNNALRIAARSWGNPFASLVKPFNEQLGRNPLRSISDDFLVVSVASGYSGCAVVFVSDKDKRFGPLWQGGFHDPCRDVFFDLSGRVLKGHKQSAHLNLLVIPHRFLPPSSLTIGLQGNTAPRFDFRPYINYTTLTPAARLLAGAEFGELDQVKAAVTAGANVNSKNKDGFTALLMALLEGSYPVSRWLLENGADPNLKSTNQFSPVCLAAFMRDEKLIRLLGEFKTNWEPRGPTHPNCEMPALISVITNAADEQDALRLVQALVDAGASPNVTYLDKSALHYALQSKYGKVSEYLKVITRRTKPAP